MQTNALIALKNVPGYAGLCTSVLLLGFAMSFANPYLSLFGVNRVGMTPLALGAYLTTTALSSIVISTLLGRWSDRLPNRQPLVVIAIAAGALGFALLSTTTGYLPVMLIGALCLGTSAAAFPQVFALAKAQTGAAGEEGMMLLRSVFSLSWVVGPGVGAALLAAGDFRGLFLVTSLCFALAALPVLRPPRNTTGPAAGPAVRDRAPGLPREATRPMAPVALSFVLYGTAMQMAAVALPLHVTQGLGGSSGDVGFLVGLCALLEIPIMLSFALRARRTSNEKLILWGLVMFTVYCALILAAPSVAWLAVAQAVRAAVIAILATLGMAYVQELMPERVGAATTLYANTMNAGALLSGLGVGVCAAVFGYQAVFVLSMLLSAAAWGLLLATRRGLRLPRWRQAVWRRSRP